MFVVLGTRAGVRFGFKAVWALLAAAAGLGAAQRRRPRSGRQVGQAAAAAVRRPAHQPPSFRRRAAELCRISARSR